MSVAVRLTKLDNSGNDVGHIDFDRKEIMEGCYTVSTKK